LVPANGQLAYRLFKPDKALGGIALFDIETRNKQFATFDDKLTLDFKWLPMGVDSWRIFAKGPDYFQRSQIGLLRRGPNSSAITPGYQ